MGGVVRNESSLSADAKRGCVGGFCGQPTLASGPPLSAAAFASRTGGRESSNQARSVASRLRGKYRRPSLCREGAVAARRKRVSGVRLRSRPPPGGGPAAGAAARPSRSAARRRRRCPAAALSEGTRQALDLTTRPLCPRTVAAARYPSMRPGRRVPPRAMPATSGGSFEKKYRRAYSATSSTPFGLGGPVGEGCGTAAVLLLQGLDIDVVADAVEPFEHLRVIGAPLADLFDRRSYEFDPPSGRAAQDLRGLRKRVLVASDIHVHPVHLLVPLEGARSEPADVVHRDHLQHRGRLDCHDEFSLVDARLEPWRQEIFHEEDGAKDGPRREPERADPLLDPELIVKMRDSGVAVRGSDRAVDEMGNPGLLRDFGESLALFLFALDARLPGVLDSEGAPRAGEGAFEARGVIQVGGHDLRAGSGESLRFGFLRLSRHRPHAVTPREEVPGYGPSLLPGRAADQDHVSVFVHCFSPLRRVLIAWRTSSILTSWSGCFQRVFPSADRTTRPWDLKPSSLTTILFSGVVASRFWALTWPGNSCSNPLTAGLTLAQTGQVGR